MNQDSTGKPIFVGDRVRWRGQEYTIKAFKEERDPVFNTPMLEFEEPLHIDNEKPYEFSIDLVGK
jgi:hypothetical protein